MQQFMNFSHTMPPLVHHKPGHQHDAETQALLDRYKIDICDALYDPVRTVLLQHAQTTSIWIRTYFLKSPDVFLSSRDHFEKLMMSWMEDPCQNNSNHNYNNHGT
jgi:hypothetical protein